MTKQNEQEYEITYSVIKFYRGGSDELLKQFTDINEAILFHKNLVKNNKHSSILGYQILVDYD